ncbi:RE1 [Symbiodinium sp. CCMP2592]|nr:RE1 [Symbiodinium sp. CCMP2592]
MPTAGLWLLEPGAPRIPLPSALYDVKCDPGFRCVSKVSDFGLHHDGNYRAEDLGKDAIAARYNSAYEVGCPARGTSHALGECTDVGLGPQFYCWSPQRFEAGETAPCGAEDSGKCLCVRNTSNAGDTLDKEVPNQHAQVKEGEDLQTGMWPVETYKQLKCRECSQHDQSQEDCLACAPKCDYGTKELSGIKITGCFNSEKYAFDKKEAEKQAAERLKEATKDAPQGEAAVKQELQAYETKETPETESKRLSVIPHYRLWDPKAHDDFGDALALSHHLFIFKLVAELLLRAGAMMHQTYVVVVMALLSGPAVSLTSLDGSRGESSVSTGEATVVSPSRIPDEQSAHAREKFPSRYEVPGGALGLLTRRVQKFVWLVGCISSFLYLGCMFQPPQGGGGAHNTLRLPPRWEPAMESTLPFRTWLQDLMLWTICTDLAPPQQAAAIISQLGGPARDLARQLTPQEVYNGGIVNGQALDPVSFLLHGLSARFAPLDEENRLRAAQDLLSFSRRQGESVDALISRFDITRQLARQEGGGAVSTDTAALILLRACGVNSEQFQTLTQPFGLRLPNTEQEFSNIHTYMAEADTGSSYSAEAWTGSGLGGDGAADMGMPASGTDWAFAAHTVGTDASGTDSETSSDRDEPLPLEDLQGMSSTQADEYLFGQYQQAKKRWRRFTGKPVRSLRRVLKRKGKGKGKQRSYLNIDSLLQQSAYFRGKGKGGSSSGKGFGRKQNPKGRDGEPLRCSICSSVYHLRARCPQRSDNPQPSSSSSQPQRAPPAFTVEPAGMHFAAFESEGSSWVPVTPRSVTSSRIEGHGEDGHRAPRTGSQGSARGHSAPAEEHALTPDPWTLNADPWMQWLHDETEHASSTVLRPNAAATSWDIPGIGSVGSRQSFGESLGFSPTEPPPELPAAMRASTADVTAPVWFAPVQQAMASVQRQHQPRADSRLSRASHITQVPSIFAQRAGLSSASPPVDAPGPGTSSASAAVTMFGQVLAFRAERQTSRQTAAPIVSEAARAQPVREFHGHVNACSICLEEFRPGDIVCRMTCGHVFHSMCVGEAAMRSDVLSETEVVISCPNCRAEVSARHSWVFPHIAEAQPDGQPETQAEPPHRNEASPAPAERSGDPEADEIHTPVREGDAEEFSSPMESFPWWPVPSHTSAPADAAEQTSYHSNVRLSDGRVGLLVDPGSYGNLVGEQWLTEAAMSMQRNPTMKSRASPLQVGGVGKGAQLCREDCTLPIDLTRQDGSVTAGSFTSPVVSQSGCPALLGLRSLQENRAILDMAKKQLHFVAPGEVTLVLPPGSETFQLESAVSGHLLLPCTSRVPATRGEHHLFADEGEAAFLNTPLSASNLEAEEAECRQVLANYDYASASALLVKLCRGWHDANPTTQGRFGQQGLSVCIGAYTHGGDQGLTKVTEERPQLSQLICRMLTSTAPQASFTSVMLNINCSAPVHMDRFNKGVNTVLPVQMPAHGGDLWVELKAGDTVTGAVEVRQDGSQAIAGQVHKLTAGCPVTFCPKAKHATTHWTRGFRVALAAHTTGGYHKLPANSLACLRDLGFAMPSCTQAHFIPEPVAARPQAESSIRSPAPAVSTGSHADQQPEPSVRSPAPARAKASNNTPSSPRGPQKSPGLPSLQFVKRVLLITIFHSTVSAFMNQGWEPFRLRPLELLRDGFDDAVRRLKGSEFDVVWVDVTDPRQFAGAERTNQVCSRLGVVFSWAERQSVPVVLAASRRTAWRHNAVQALLDRGRYFMSHHSWCRFGARIHAATSAAKHKVYCSLKLPSHDCNCPPSTEHVFDLDDKSAGSSRIRAAAEQTVVEQIITVLSRALDARSGPSKPTDSVPCFPSLAAGSVRSSKHVSFATTNYHTCTECGLLLHNKQGCQFCGECTGPHRADQAYPVTSPTSAVTRFESTPSPATAELPGSCESFPTDTKIAQKLRKQAEKAKGVEALTKRRRKPVEQHFDDCGEDLTSLSALAVEDPIAFTSDSEEESLSRAACLVQPQVNAFETWSQCGCPYVDPAECSDQTMIAVDIEEMQRILSEPAFAGNGVEIVELLGGGTSKTQICVRRQLKSGRSFELMTDANAMDPAAQHMLLAYIATAKPLLVLMAPVHQHAAAPSLANLTGAIAAEQSKQQRFFLIEQPYPSDLYNTHPWPAVREDSTSRRIVFHQCMTGQLLNGLPFKRPTELVANSATLLKPFENLGCDGLHVHAPMRGNAAVQPLRWPPAMRSRMAYAVQQLMRELCDRDQCHLTSTTDEPHAALNAFPSVATGPTDEGEVAVGEAWRKCKGCLWRLQQNDPMHTRIRGECKHPDVKALIFDCPACKARRNRSDEGHTFGPDCRHVLTSQRAKAVRKRPYARIPASSEPTAGLRASSLGREAEHNAEDAEGARSVPSEPSAPSRPLGAASSSENPASSPQTPPGAAETRPGRGPAPPGAAETRPGRGPDVAPRVRRTWDDTEVQTEAPSDWSSFDVQASLRGLRHADEAGRRRILRKLHLRWYHCGTEKLTSLLRAAGLGKDVLDLVPEIVDTCRICRRWARPSADAKTSCRMIVGFNIEVEGDLMFYRHQGKQHIVLVLVDRGVRWCATALVSDRSTNTLLTNLDRAWISVFGPMQVLIFDGEGGLDDEESTTYFQLRGITKRTSAPNQHTRIADRRIAILRDSLHKLSSQLQEEGLSVPFERMMCEMTFALNALTNVNGQSPYTAVLGRIPAILPSDDSLISDGVPDRCSSHTHRLREIAVQTIAEGTARERLKRALKTPTRPSSIEEDYKVGDAVDYWREPLNKDSSGWRGPSTVVDLSRLEHGRIGIRTSTDQVLTCRLQDVRHSLTFLSDELSAFFGADDLIAPAGSQANHAQQYVQTYTDSLKHGTVLTLGHIRTSAGQWTETPQTEAHREVYRACMFLAETVFQLSGVVAVRLAHAVRTLTAREEYSNTLLLWWSAPGSRNISFLHSEASRVSTVELLSQAWSDARLIQFLCVPDDEGWATSVRWTSPTADSVVATSSEAGSVQRLSTVPEESEGAESESFVAWSDLCAVFGDSIPPEDAASLTEAYLASSSEPAPHPPGNIDLPSMCSRRNLIAMSEAEIPNWHAVNGDSESSWATEAQMSTYLACADTASEAEVLDADEVGAYVALEVYGDMCKLVEGLSRLPEEGEHVEVRMYETHTRKAVIDRSDDLLTQDEVRLHAAEVTQAVLNELKTWQSFKCFARKPRSQCSCIIDAKWVYKWKYVKGVRTIRARLCLRGFKESGADDQSNFATTASRFSQRLLVSECVLRGWVIASSDVPKAFLQGVSYDELAEATDRPRRDVSFELSGEGLACLKMLPEFATFNPRTEALHCLKPGTGCRDAPRAFSMKLRQVTEKFGFKSSSVDSELELLHQSDELVMAIIKHVDDLKMIGPRRLIEEFVKHLTATFGRMDIEWHVFAFCGIQHRQAADGSISLDQNKFLAACKPITQPSALSGPAEKLLPEEARRHFLSLLMTLAYGLLTRPDIAVFITALQRESHQARIVHVKRLNTLLLWVQANPRSIQYPVMPYPDMLLQISDSSYKAKAEDGLSVRGLVSVRVSAHGVNEGLKSTHCHLVDFASKAQRHVTRSTFSSELFASTDAADIGLLHTVALHELKHGVLSPTSAKQLSEGELECSVMLGLAIDARSVSTAVIAPNIKVPAEPSLLLHVCWLRALLVKQRLRYLYWVDTRSMVADGLTKGSCSRSLLQTVMGGTLQMDQPYELQEIRQ